jgi:molybdopterin-binding protein
MVGKNVIATIKPEDIMLSKSADYNSAQTPSNTVEGTIVEMVQMRSNAQVTVEAGFLIKTRVSLSSIKSLGLSIGDNVHVVFSADALNVFEDNSRE